MREETRVGRVDPMQGAEEECAYGDKQREASLDAGSGNSIRIPHSSRPSPLEKSPLRKREVATPPNHHVVRHRNVEQSPGGHQLRGDGTIVRRRRRIATRMIV